MKRKKTKLIPFLSTYEQEEVEMTLPLKKTVKRDVLIPSNLMDPDNTRPGSVWTVETSFTLQTNEDGESAYIQTDLLDAYLKTNDDNK